MGDDEREPEQVSGELVAPDPELRNLRRKADGTFEKGTSGCPGGRAIEEREVIRLARQRGPEVIKRLFQIAMRRSDGAAVRAAEVLLERGFGKAPLKFTDADGKELQIRGIIIMPAERGDSDEEGGDDGE